MLTMIFLCIFSFNNPYNDEADQHLQLLVHTGIFLIVMIQLIKDFDQNIDDTYEFVLGNLIIAIIFIVIGIIIFAYVDESSKKHLNVNINNNFNSLIRKKSTNYTNTKNKSALLADPSTITDAKVIRPTSTSTLNIETSKIDRNTGDFFLARPSIASTND